MNKAMNMIKQNTCTRYETGILVVKAIPPSAGECPPVPGCLPLPARDEGEDLHRALQGHQLQRQGAAGGRQGGHEEGVCVCVCVCVCEGCERE